MNVLKLINPYNVSEEDVEKYSNRSAARAIVTDADGKVAVLHVSKHGYYKLPGGGVDEGEDFVEALHRECTEEIGCEIEDINEVGIIIEYREYEKLKQTSYCYTAKVLGEKGTPGFTEEELSNGFENVWLPYDEALKTLSEAHTKDDEGREYIVLRDTIFLQEAGKFIK